MKRLALLLFAVALGTTGCGRSSNGNMQEQFDKISREISVSESKLRGEIITVKQEMKKELKDELKKELKEEFGSRSVTTPCSPAGVSVGTRDDVDAVERESRELLKEKNREEELLRKVEVLEKRLKKIKDNHQKGYPARKSLPESSHDSSSESEVERKFRETKSSFLAQGYHR